MKSGNLKIILAATFIAFALNLFFGKFLIAKISTWPLLNRFKILNPQAPIVIHEREEIRLTDSGQISDAVNASRPKISSVVFKEGSNLSWKGSAINLTSNGSFVAAAESFTAPGEYWVVLADGRSAVISKLVSDVASGLVFFEAALDNIPIATFADSKAILAGERVFLFLNRVEANQWQAWPDYVIAQENFRFGEIYNSAKILRNLKISSAMGFSERTSLLNIKGEIAGLIVNNKVIPGDVIKSATGLYLSNKEKISRPDFGFNYINIGAVESVVNGTNLQGARVVSVLKGSPFKEGDIITQVSGQEISNNNFLEEVLEKYKVNDEVTFKVSRQSQVLEIKVRAKESK